MWMARSWRSGFPQQGVTVEAVCTLIKVFSASAASLEPSDDGGRCRRGADASTTAADTRRWWSADCYYRQRPWQARNPASRVTVVGEFMTRISGLCWGDLGVAITRTGGPGSR